MRCNVALIVVNNKTRGIVEVVKLTKNSWKLIDKVISSKSPKDTYLNYLNRAQSMLPDSQQVKDAKKVVESIYDRYSKNSRITWCWK